MLHPLLSCPHLTTSLWSIDSSLMRTSRTSSPSTVQGRDGVYPRVLPARGIGVLHSLCGACVCGTYSLLHSSSSMGISRAQRCRAEAYFELSTLPLPLPLEGRKSCEHACTGGESRDTSRVRVTPPQCVISEPAHYLASHSVHLQVHLITFSV